VPSAKLSGKVAQTLEPQGFVVGEFSASFRRVFGEFLADLRKNVFLCNALLNPNNVIY